MHSEFQKADFRIVINEVSDTVHDMASALISTRESCVNQSSSHLKAEWLRFLCTAHKECPPDQSRGCQNVVRWHDY